jgi:hypothetical protein
LDPAKWGAKEIKREENQLTAATIDRAENGITGLIPVAKSDLSCF